jgi:hypothetical protein
LKRQSKNAIYLSVALFGTAVKRYLPDFWKMRESRKTGKQRFVKGDLVSFSGRSRGHEAECGFSQDRQVISRAHPTKAACPAKAVDGEGAETG